MAFLRECLRELRQRRGEWEEFAPSWPEELAACEPPERESFPQERAADTWSNEDTRPS